MSGSAGCGSSPSRPPRWRSASRAIWFSRCSSPRPSTRYRPPAITWSIGNAATASPPRTSAPPRLGLSVFRSKSAAGAIGSRSRALAQLPLLQLAVGVARQRIGHELDHLGYLVVGHAPGAESADLLGADPGVAWAHEGLHALPQHRVRAAHHRAFEHTGPLTQD